MSPWSLLWMATSIFWLFSIVPYPVSLSQPPDCWCGFTVDTVRVTSMTSIMHNFKFTISGNPFGSHSYSASSPPLSFKKHYRPHFFVITPSIVQYNLILIPTISRRLLIPSVSGLWDAITGNNSAREALLAIRRGMQLFRQVVWVLDLNDVL